MPAAPRFILPVIILSQFAGTSLWFAGNAVLADLQRDWGLAADALGGVTSAVQLGFIAGTLAFAFLAVSDRHSPRMVFLACSLFGAAANAMVFVLPHTLWPLLVSRFLIGFFLAGIYPVGMKIASGWYQKGLGNAIGLLVGALVLGTAFPHLVRSLGTTLPWEAVLAGVSLVAALGGVAMLAVPDGPHLHRGTAFDPRALAQVFRSGAFRASSFGYFGHMWELYAFWAFVPVALAAQAAAQGTAIDVPFWAFAVIAAGSIGSAGGGFVSLRAGSARVAFVQLAASGLCCAASPWMFNAPTPLFLAFVVFWGVVVVGDSPQFSALNAQNAPRHLVGSALTIVNCIGYVITIAGIQLVNHLAIVADARWLFLPLAIGPLLGLAALSPLLRRPRGNDR